MFLILAMVLAAAGMKAYENSKARSKARWDEARHRAEERSAERDRERQARAKAWEKRFDTAISTGPRSALWWPYAAGWVIGGGIAAIGAGTVGAVSGAIAGGKSGYALGQIAGEHGRKAGETFQAWRKANRGKGDPVELGICGRCKGWIRKDQLVSSAEHGKVCPDCAPAPTTPKPPPWVQDHNDAFERGALNDEPIAVVHERIPGDDGPRRRCTCGAVLFHADTLCPTCRMRITWMKERAKARREEEERARAGQRQQEQAEQAAKAEQEMNGPIRVTAERIYPEPEEEANPKEIAMTYALPTGQDYGTDTSAESIGGILATLATLTEQSRSAVSNLTDLTDSMSGKHFAAADLTAIAEVIDAFEPVVTQLEQANERIQEHQGVDVAASELGSDRMADSSVYGNA